MSGKAAIEPAVAAFCVCLDDFARLCDEIVGVAEKRIDSDAVTDLIERFEAQRGKVALASRGAVGCPMPAGPIGVELVASLKACNARVRAGADAHERLLSSRQTVQRLGELCVVQAMRNLPAIAAWPSATRLAEAFRGRPAVLVAAGPSLEKNVRLLAHFKGKAVIIAVSHAALALQRAGIVPDLCIAIDPQDLLYHFEGVPVEQFGAIVCGVSVCSGVLALPARRFLTLAANDVVDSWVYDGLEKHIALSSAGSVATDAFSLVTLFGCNPIILVGQDLSFPGGRFYAASSCDGDAQITVSEDRSIGIVSQASGGYQSLADAASPVLMREVPGYYGGTVPTSYTLHKAWTWFVQAAAQALESNRKVLNCTEGGAHIDGMEHVPLAEAVARYATQDVDVPAVLDSVVASIDREARRLRTLARVERMSTALTDCATKARECSRLAEKAKTRPAALKKLGEVERDLMHAIERVSFVSGMVQKEIRLAMSAGKRSASAKDGLDASLAIFAAVIRLTETIRAPVLEARRLLAVPSRAVGSQSSH